jgi:CrcB protein
MARHGTNMLVTRLSGQSLPYATAAANILGCLIIGLLAGSVASSRLHLSPGARAFVFVGVLGGFTTFSSFGLDTLTLAHEGRPLAALWNVIGQVGLGLASTFAGYALALRSG